MKIKRIGLATVSIMILSVGVATSLKANIGVGAWDALAETLGIISNIKIGTMGMILNGSCIIIQLFLLKKDFGIKHILQIVVVIVLGSMINFMYYTVLQNITIKQYMFKFIFLIIGNIIAAFGVSTLLLTNTISLPVEGVCEVLEEQYDIPFSKLRQSVDVVSIVLTLILTYLFKTSLSIREGTVVSMLMFGPLIGYFMKKMQPVLVKYDLSD